MRVALLKRSLQEAAGCYIPAWVEGRVPFGKLQEANHFLWGVDISQGIVRVHQHKPSHGKTLQEEGNFYFKCQKMSSVDKAGGEKWSVLAFAERHRL